jgi:sulfite exporter TauE/SafE
MLANCLHDLAAIGGDGVAAVCMALFLAGLAGGITHCAGMCAPFVVAQANAAAKRAGAGGTLARLSGAALLPYHGGRVLGYSALGAISGLGAGAVSQITGMRFLLAGLLLVAAVLMARQASNRLPVAWRRWLPSLPGPFAPTLGPRWVHALGARITLLLAAPQGWNSFGLGLLLSGLPCGLLYAALAGAAATGSALAGAMAMLAFCLGTVPALVGVAMLGRLFLREFGPAFRAAGVALFAVNALVLAVMALRLVA